MPERYKLELRLDLSACPECAETITVLRTNKSFPITLKLGRPEVTTIDYECPKCLWQGSSLSLKGEVEPLKQYGLDVVCEVGLARFRDHQSGPVIAQLIDDKYGLRVPVGSISGLADTFLDYFGLVHELSSTTLKEVIKENGGYVLHLDGTSEINTDMLFTAVATHTPMVLDAVRIPSENKADVKPLVDRVIERFGLPLALMSDLSESIRLALEEIPEEIPRLVCHYHFLHNLGKKLFADKHKELLSFVSILERMQIRRKDYMRSSRGKEPITSEELEDVLQGKLPAAELDSAQLRRRVANAALLWLADYRSELNKEHFPFELPALVLAQRIKELHRMLNTTFAQIKPNHNCCRRKIGSILFDNILKDLDAVIAKPRFAELVSELAQGRELFHELRSCLRLHPPGSQGNALLERHRQADITVIDIQESKQQTDAFIKTLDQSIESNSTKAAFARTIKNDLMKYNDRLFAHVLSDGEATALIPRTNYPSEGHFCTLKTNWRKRLGTGRVRRCMQHIRPEEALTDNLTNPAYLKAVYHGDVASMPFVFSRYYDQVKARRAQMKRNPKQMNTPKSILRDRQFLDQLATVIATLAS